VNRIAALRRRLDRSLFLDAPARATNRAEELVLAVAVLILGTVGQLLRPGFDASLNALWAEDGMIFLQGATYDGFIDAVFSPYAGYLVVVPRLIGEAAAAVPIEEAAAAVSILSAAVAALSALIVWHASAAQIPNPLLRGTLAALTVLAPVAGLESLDSAAYAPWYMLFAAFWLLLWRPRSMVAACLAAVFLLATGVSTPGVWFFAPLAALRTLALRDRRDGAIVSGFWAGAIAQVPVLLLNNEEAVEPVWTNEIWAAYVQRVVDGAALGERIGGSAWSHLGWPFLALLMLGALIALALGLRHSDARGRWFAAVALPTSLALFVVSAYQRAVGDQIVWPVDNYHGAAGRYAIVPALLLVSVALLLIDRASGVAMHRRGAKTNTGRRNLLALAAAAVLGIGLVTSFDVRNDAARGTPPWDEALSAAASTCVADRLSDVTVPVSPPPFGVLVPCERIESLAEVRPAR
jgi:hypothetical protein